MSIKFTDTQLIALSAAARREDRCLIMPDKLKGAAAGKFFDKLLGLGFVKEIKAKTGMPVCRKDEETGHGYSLKLTAAGLKAIAVEEKDDDDTERGTMATVSPRVAEAPVSAARTAPAAAVAITGMPQRGSISEVSPVVPASPAAPREGTKLADVIGLLERDRGATIAELIAATDWLPHTTRAALTGLRKRGYQVTLDRSDKARGSVYGIAPGRAA
jgi:hypothetical protein